MRFLQRSLFVCAASAATLPMAYSAAVEAPAGFDDLTNGFVIQAQFDQDRAVFEEREGLADGLGPVYIRHWKTAVDHCVHHHMLYIMNPTNDQQIF